MSDITYGGSKKYDGPYPLTITLASQGTPSTTGAARQSNMVASKSAANILIGIKYSCGTGSLQGNSIAIGVIRSDGSITDDNAGTADADIVVNAAQGIANINTITSGTALLSGIIPVSGPIPPYFAVFVQNLTLGVAGTNPAGFAVEYTLVY